MTLPPRKLSSRIRRTILQQHSHAVMNGKIVFSVLYQWNCCFAAASTTRFQAAGSAGQLQAIGREVTPGVKTNFTARDLERVRKAFAARLAQLQSVPTAEANGAVLA
jgi:hypothetical protein